MLPLARRLCAVLIVLTVSTSAYARQWTDITGHYTLEADLIGFDDQMVVLQRANKELGSCPIDQLSEEDRAYLKSKEALDAHKSNLGQLQTWTTANGLKVIGKIVDYARRDVTVQSRRGKTYVNTTLYSNLPDVYRTMLRRVLEHLEGIELPDEASLQRWVRNLRGEAKTYTLDGVIMELENGDEYGIPFFLLSKADQEVLRAGWQAWLADRQEEENQLEHSLRLQSQAAAYQQDQALRRQVAMMRFNMEAIRTGLTSAWEVTLYPGPGNPGPPLWVVTLGRNSEVATLSILQQHPGYVRGPVRKVSR